MSILSGDARNGRRINERKETRRARRRFQNGWIFKKGRNWVFRYREDIRRLDGTVFRKQRSVVLGPLRGKREAQTEAAKRLRAINGGAQRPQSSMTFSDFWNEYFDPEVIEKRKISVPIASSVLPALEAWLHVRSDDSEWLFPNEAGKPYYERNLLRRKLWPVCDRLGIPRFGWHSLRHTFSTYGGNSGVPLPVLQYLLWHASVETTMLYTHPLGEAQRMAVERMASILLPNAPSSADAEGGVKVVIQ